MRCSSKLPTFCVTATFCCFIFTVYCRAGSAALVSGTLMEALEHSKFSRNRDENYEVSLDRRTKTTRRGNISSPVTYTIKSEK